MKQDDEIDKLFRDNLENSSMPDIPQSYLDDLNKRLDTITPTTKFGNFQSLFGILSVVGLFSVVSLVIYIAIINSKSDKLKNDQKNSAVNSTNSNLENDSINKIEKINSNNEANTLAEPENKDSEHTTTSTDIVTTNSASSVISVDKSGNEKQLMEKGSENNSNTSSSKLNNKTNTLVSASAKERKNKVDKTALNKSDGQDNITVTTNSNVSSKIKDAKKSRSKNNTVISAVNVNGAAIADKENLKAETAKPKQNISKGKTNKINKIKSSAFAEANKGNVSKLSDKKELSDVSVSKTEKNKLVEISNNPDTIQSNSDKNLTSTTDKKDSLLTINKQLNANNHNLDSLKKVSVDTVVLAAKDTAKLNGAATLKPLSDSSANVLKGVKSVQFLIGAANVNSIFASKNSNYDAKRKAEETAIWAFDASVLLNYTKNKFVYSLGINFSQWGENIKYKATTNSTKFLKGEDTTYTTQQIDSVTFVTTPKINLIYGNQVVTNNAITAHNGKNRYTYLSVPFLFGYEFGINSVSIIPKIGGMLGMSIQSKGFYVSPDLQKLVQEKANSLLFNFQLQVDLQKKINSYTSICISPVVRSNVSPLIHSENTSNRYYSYGIQIGASYIIH